MSALTQDMKDIAAKTGVFILATSSKDGKPNTVPIGIVKVKDDTIVLADNFMNKTRKNLEENPLAAVTYWSNDAHYGYQIKGKARIETSGEDYDAMANSMKERKMPFTCKAVVIVPAEEAYYIGAGKETGDNLL